VTHFASSGVPLDAPGCGGWKANPAYRVLGILQWWGFVSCMGMVRESGGRKSTIGVQGQSPGRGPGRSPPEAEAKC